MVEARLVAGAEGLDLDGAGIDIDPGEFGAEGGGLEFRADAGEGEVGGGLGEVLRVAGGEFLGGSGEAGADGFDLAQGEAVVGGGNDLVDAALNAKGPVAVSPDRLKGDFEARFRELLCGLFGGGLMPFLSEGGAPGSPAGTRGGRGIAEARQFTDAELYGTLEGINLHGLGGEAGVTAQGLKEEHRGGDEGEPDPCHQRGAGTRQNPIPEERGEGSPESC